MTRKLSFESMEARRLLAADVASHQEETTIEVASDFSANAFAEVGNLDGTVNVSSSLGYFNYYDRIGFSVEREADVSIRLDGFWTDVDLYLTDSRGYVIDYSVNWGRTAESIDVTIEPGNYYVWSLATSWYTTGYHMELTADQVPEPLPEPEPVPETGVPSDGVSPLTDVAYFGGSNEWGLNEVGAPEAWAAGYTGQGITVAVIDTGVDLDHPDLYSNIYVNAGEIAGNGIDDDGNGYVDDVHGFDFADWDADANDVHGHGTHVAGTIAALDNGWGATGVAPDATILPVKVLGDNGSGSSTSVAAGIRYAADQGADIINLSLGGGYSYDIESAIEYARSLGSFVIAAAGNEYASMPGFPARFSASLDNVLSVGAFDSSGNIAAFSNDVGGSGAVQIDAPGVGVYSTYVGGGFARMSGTSMATPHVVGVAALTLSANPSLAPSALRDLLVSGVVGNANGSDGLGKVSTLYSVAWAAAGVSGGTASGGGAASGTDGSGGVGASSFAAASDLLDEPDAADVDVVFEDASNLGPNDSLVKARQASENSRTEDTDAVFEDYFASDDSDDQWSVENDSDLELLAIA
ncbi:S8 family serine peptidase [Stieleria sp. JC731]|uniref:S8 family serine peptidase n=1 Tax=Pirellulaceae TaxID=2691357 RepID=UPI001E53E07B|nr:S8 family serine peptidase [Stieleria sp. JC731]MCC9602071.1 S8 family serine peptidase [Stieleria sp. JC731]